MMSSSSSSISSVYNQCKNELWHTSGMLPIQFCLHEYEITTSKIINPIYVLASRYSYLSIIAEDIIRYLQEITIECSSDIWFESNNIPLKRYVS